MKKKPTAGRSGGYRPGAGRPKGTGRYGEKTIPMRIPVSLISYVENLLAEKNLCSFDNVYAYPKSSLQHFDKQKTIPFYATRVAAGAPLPVDDHVERYLDLNQHLIERPDATFFVRAEGESMINANIYENDILVVDRTIVPTNGKIIIAVVNGELTVKRLELQTDRIRLLPENPAYKPIHITEDTNFKIWGVVVHIIHSLS